MKPYTLLASLIIMNTLAICASFQIVYSSETRPWGVERIRAYCAWDNNMDVHIDNVTDPRAGQNIVVAVIDFGIDYLPDGTPTYHEDLNENVWRDAYGRGGIGFFYNSVTRQVEQTVDHRDDPNGLYKGHGTHVCGTIAAVDNDIGVIGTAPKAEIYMLKLVTGDSRELVAAINYAANMGQVRIIVMSLGFNGSDTNPPRLEDACMNAYNNGKLIFAAAGNYNSSVIDYPAKYSCVVAVGAVYQNLSRWVGPKPGEGSNYGPELDFVAPGVDINSTFINDGYALMTGTSMACPHVAAEAAMIWGSKLDRDFDFNNNGRWDAPEVLAKLCNWTLDLGQLGRDDMYGLGLINAWATSQRPVGDVNCDYIVDIRDVARVSRAYGTKPGDQLWDPRADVNIDNEVDIHDLAIVSRNYGKVDP